MEQNNNDQSLRDAVRDAMQDAMRDQHQMMQQMLQTMQAMMTRMEVQNRAQPIRLEERGEIDGGRERGLENLEAPPIRREQQRHDVGLPSQNILNLLHKVEQSREINTGARFSDSKQSVASEIPESAASDGSAHLQHSQSSAFGLKSAPPCQKQPLSSTSLPSQTSLPGLNDCDSKSLDSGAGDHHQITKILAIPPYETPQRENLDNKSSIFGKASKSGIYEKSLVPSSLHHARNRDISSTNEHRPASVLLSQRLEPDARLLSDFVVAFSRAGDPDRALSLLAAAQAQGLTPKTSAVTALLSALGAAGRVPEAEALFLEFHAAAELQPRTRAYNALLKGYVKIGALKDAELVFEEMERCSVSPDEGTYSLLIDAYTNAGRWESARILIKEMEVNGVQPNSYVFSRILASFRDKGEWQKSFVVLREMRNNGIRPDRHFYNVMIDAFGKYNCLHHAMDAFERMRSDGIEPDAITWNTLIDSHCKAGRHDKAMELFQEMQESGCTPCTTTYNIVINSLGQQARWEELKGMLERMKGQGLLPNVVTYTTLVDVYGKSGRFKEAIECLEAMKAGGLKPSPTMYHALVNAYAQRGLSEQAINAFRVMRADGLKPSVIVLNSLINAFGEDQRDTEAFSVLQFMKGAESDPSKQIGKKFKGADLGFDALQMELTGQRLIFGQNAVLKELDASFQASVKMLNFSSKENEGKSSSACSQVTGRDLSYQDLLTSRQHDIQSHANSHRKSSMPTSVGGNGQPQIGPQMAPSWFEQYQTYKNGQILEMYDGLGNSQKTAKGGTCFFAKVSESMHNGVVAEQINNVSQVGNLQQNTSSTTKAANEDSPSHCLPPGAIDKNMILMPKKRKSATSELLPWHKEVIQGSRRMQTISIAELGWAQTANRLIEKVEDEFEIMEDGTSIARLCRRLVLTTQLMQQLIPCVPARFLNADATAAYGSLMYFGAKLGLGDACSFISCSENDSRMFLNNRKMRPEELKTDEKAGDSFFFKVMENFIGRLGKLESSFLRLEKRSSLLDLRVECQVLEKFGDNAYRVELPDDVFISDVFNIRHLTPYAGENSSLRSSFSEEGESDEDISSDQGSGQSNQSLDVPVPATQSQQATSGKPIPGSPRRSKRLQNKRA